MSTLIPLYEYFNPVEAALVESRDAQKNLYLSGRMMAGETENLNKRKYAAMWPQTTGP